MDFLPGQWVNIGVPGSGERREYTIYSPPSRDFLEVLIREIQEGTVSRALGCLRPGDEVEVEGPHGAFLVPHQEKSGGRHLFLATGTGVSPFHCFVESYPDLDYLLLHGVRNEADLFDSETYQPSRYLACVSADGSCGQRNCYRGRLTAYLRNHPVESDRLCYLCGNSDMIYEAFGILAGFGVPRDRIFAEVYF